jgi:uncharacterized repeat protein (TIGR01451 family)
MNTVESYQKLSQHRRTLLSFVLATIMIFVITQSLQAQQGIDRGTRQPASLEDSSISVDRNQARAGDTLGYTINLSNSGSSPANDVSITNTLPASLTYQPDSLTVVGGGSYGESNGVITWIGTVEGKAQVTISFNAIVSEELSPGTEIQNTVQISGPKDSLLTRTATTTVTAVTSNEVGSTLYYLPFVTKQTVFAPILNPIGRPNGNNEWTVSWDPNNTGPVNIELQESTTPTFSTIENTYDVGMATSHLISKTPGLKNVFYYRARAKSLSGEIIGPWSNVVSVIGGYRDDFNDSNSGWAIRRTTYLEEVRTWYEEGWLIFQVEDSWDWGIASPMVPAPDLPYAIEYRSKNVHLANLVSGGAAFGADWPGSICPDYSSIPGIYGHDLCFNHFYNINTIWFGHLKILFERVDYLNWCPSCGGSQLKRLSNDYDAWFEVEPVPNVNPSDWNTWRVEVRNSGIKIFANNQQIASTSDTTWVNERYFGVFGSTDEYSNSTWRYEYYEVVPLDN